MIAVIARLVRSADFERVLRVRTGVNTPHFALHHLPEAPSVTAGKRLTRAAADQLSTASASLDTVPVESLPPFGPPKGLWLGTVVPKRHARRAVTRSLLKRQIRCVAARYAALLAGGLWVVRLRAPFDRAQFISAASDALRDAARDELEGLLGNAVRRAAGR